MSNCPNSQELHPNLTLSVPQNVNFPNFTPTDSKASIRNIKNLSGSKVNSTAVFLQQSDVRQINTHYDTAQIFRSGFTTEIKTQNHSENFAGIINEQQIAPQKMNEEEEERQMEENEQLAILYNRIQYLEEQLQEVNKLMADSLSKSLRTEDSQIQNLKNENQYLMGEIEKRDKEIADLNEFILNSLGGPIQRNFEDSSKKLKELAENYEGNSDSRNNQVSSSRSKKSNHQLQQDIIVLNQQIKQMLEKLQMMNEDYSNIKSINQKLIEENKAILKDKKELLKQCQILRQAAKIVAINESAQRQRVSKLESENERIEGELIQYKKQLKRKEDQIVQQRSKAIVSTQKQLQDNLKEEQLEKMRADIKVLSQNLLTQKMIEQQNIKHYEALIEYHKTKSKMANDTSSQLSLQDKHCCPQSRCPIHQLNFQQYSIFDNLGQFNLYDRVQKRERQQLQKFYQKKMESAQKTYQTKSKQVMEKIERITKQNKLQQQEIEKFIIQVRKLEKRNHDLEEKIVVSQENMRISKDYRAEYLEINKQMLAKESEYRKKMEVLEDQLKKCQLQCEYHKNSVYTLMDQYKTNLDALKRENFSIQKNQQSIGINKQNKELKNKVVQLTADKKKLAKMTETILQKYEQLSNNCTCWNSSRTDRSRKSGHSCLSQKIKAPLNLNLTPNGNKLDILRKMRQQLENVDEHEQY